MDNYQLKKIVNNFSTLKFKFLGCFPADRVPYFIPLDMFCIVNSDVSTSPGTHWMLLANKKNLYYFADSLGKPISYYYHLQRQFHQSVNELVSCKLQNSDLCGLYCIYFAYVLYNNLYEYNINDSMLMRFFASVL